MKKRARTLVTSSVLISALLTGSFSQGAFAWGWRTGGSSSATRNISGETRTISLYHIHTKESLTITYMVGGKYVPSAMKKLNHLLRDWRRNEEINMDPRTIDLMWELHADLGSKTPIHIVCGYRSPNTNAFLKRIGRNVAKHSQHMLGKAIDIYFTDVNTKIMRNSALVRQVGGVGYYSSAGGPTGFLHIDSGHVRHWGPAISNSEMASIFSKYRKTVGARLNGADRTMVAMRESTKVSTLPTGPSLYDGAGDEGDDEAIANAAPAEIASAVVAKAKAETKQAAAPEPKAVADEPPAEAVVAELPIPKPRQKPIEVLMMAAATMRVEPASAPPPNQMEGTHPISEGVAYALVQRPAEIDEELVDANDQSTNKTGKGNFAGAIIKRHNANRPVVASAGGDLNWWPQRSNTAATPHAVTAEQPTPDANGDGASGKGDLLVIDRSGKGSLPGSLPDLIKG